MKRTVKYINSAALLAWILLISFLLYRHYTGSPLEKSAALTEAFETITHWYDMYNMSKKIGYTETLFERAGHEIIVTHNRQIKVEKNNKDVLLIQRLRYLCNNDFSIKSFTYSFGSYGDTETVIRGNLDEDKIIFIIESGEERETHTVPTGGTDPFLPITMIPAIVQKSPSPGSRYVVPMLNLTNFSIDNVSVLLEEIIPVKVGINTRSIYRFKMGGSTVWSNERGIIVKERLPTGIILYSQEEKMALDTADRIIFDFVKLPAFKSNRLLPDTEALNTMKVRISGIKINENVFDKGCVTFSDGTITINKEKEDNVQGNSYQLPLDVNSLREYTASDSWINSNLTVIAHTAGVYARTHDYDAYKLTTYLNSYLFSIIKPLPTFFLGDSQAILDTRSGDYLARTVMFASYGRSAGLPVRLIGGLVYKDGYFYYHTWNEVWFNKWIPVDPTFHQFPADVTHIPLVEGDLTEITSIVKELKNINIEILEAS